MKKYNFISLLICLIIFSINGNATTPVDDTIVVDDIRNLQFNENTVLTIDRRTVVEEETRASEQFGTGFLGRTIPGFKAKINYVSTGDNQGDLSDMNLLNSVVGPVTINDGVQFQVLFVNLVVDADTVIVGIDDISELQKGDIVAASGIETEEGSVRATRLEFLTEGSEYWLITGDVTNLAESGLDIGQQHINITNDNPNNSTQIICHNELLENGKKIIADLVPKPDFINGDALDALAIICYQEFDPPINPPPSGDPVFFNGDIEQINADQTQIVVAGTVVNINDTTEIFSSTGNGSVILEIGQNVSVNGYIDAETNEVVAEFIVVNDDNNPPPPLPIVLFGEATEVTAESFNLNGQLIGINDTTEYINGTNADLVDGALVEVFALSSDPSNPQASGLMALQIIFMDGNNPPNGDFIQLEGEISNLTDDHMQFTMSNETIIIGADTFLLNTTIEQLADGLFVFVEGERDTETGNVNALFLVTDNGGPINPPGGHVCLSGVINTVNGEQTQFVLESGVIVNVTAETTFVNGTQSDLISGTFVDIGGIVPENNEEVTAEVIFFEPDTPPPTSDVFFNGFITNVAADFSQITVNDTVVNLSAETEIFGGQLVSLVVGLQVSVVGIVNSETGEVDAFAIIISRKRVAASVPALSSDVTLSDAGAQNGKIILMEIEVNQNELTADYTGVFTDGIADNDIIVFFGYQDSDGIVWAESIFSSKAEPGPGGGNGGPGIIFFDGTFTSSTASSLIVMGVNISNLDGATFYDENQQPVSYDDFRLNLSTDYTISITRADAYDRETNTLNALEVFKHNNSNTSQSNPDLRSGQTVSGGNNVSGSGIVTRVIEDVIFSNEF